MTVRELRLELEKMDQDKPIIFECSSWYGEEMRFNGASVHDSQDASIVCVDIF